jgi:sugar lactone lactonase YvrE
MSATVELIVDGRDAVGESPVWREAEQALYWTDIPARKLHRWSVATGVVSTWATPQMVGCIAPMALTGQWVAAMEDDVYALTLHDDGRLDSVCLAGVDHAQPGMRFNDGRCDRQGRFWAGTMVQNMGLAAQAGGFYRYSADAGLACVVPDLITPNGMAFSPDGRTMYLSDSHPNVQTIWAFDYDVATATPSNRRVFVDMKPLAGRPDGAAVDTDGCYWICANDAGLLHRFTPAGRLDRSIVGADGAQGRRYAPGGYPTVVAVENMGKKLEAARPTAAYKMQMFPGAVLGQEKEMVEQTQIGASRSPASRWA